MFVLPLIWASPQFPACSQAAAARPRRPTNYHKTMRWSVEFRSTNSC